MDEHGETARGNVSSRRSTRPPSSPGRLLGYKRSGWCTPGGVSLGGRRCWGQRSCHLRGDVAGAGRALQETKEGPGAPYKPALGALGNGGGEIRERAGGQKQHLSDTPFHSDLSNFPQRQTSTFPHRTPSHPASRSSARTCGQLRRGLGGSAASKRRREGRDPKYNSPGG